MGFTHLNPFVRVTQHNSGSNNWSTLNKPFVLVYYEQYECVTDARKRELFYKTGFGKEIKKVIVDHLQTNGIRPKEIQPLAENGM